MSDAQPNGGVSTQDADIAAKLDLLLNKMSRIESTVARLEEVVENAPAMVSVAADTIDEMYVDAASHGVVLEERVKTGASLLVRLTEPEMARTLENLMDRVESLSDTLEQAPGMVSMMADTADEMFSQAAERGINVDERARQTLQLVERLTDPKTVHAINVLLDNIEPLTGALQDGPGMVAMAMDTLDEMYVDAAEAGYDLEQIAKQSIDVASRFAGLVQSDELSALMASGALDPRALTVIGHAANALVASRETKERVGVVGLLGALNDPNVQLALGFLLSFGKKFGENLQNGNGSK